ncbi:hypothetical protein ABIF14_002537 [Bradyrhizobium elkanii]
MKVEAGNLPSPERTLSLADDQVVLDLVADECAFSSEIEEPFLQLLAKLAALVGHVGEAA